MCLPGGGGARYRRHSGMRGSAMRRIDVSRPTFVLIALGALAIILISLNEMGMRFAVVHLQPGTLADWWMFGVTTLLLGVGVAQLLMFYRQLNSMTQGLAQATVAADAARLAAESGMRSERAHLYLDEERAKLDRPGDGSGRAWPLLVVHNYGKTPGLIEKSAARWRSSPGGEGGEWEVSIRRLTGRVVGAGASDEDRIPAIVFEGRDEELELEGFYIYRDVFENRHVLEYRLKITRTLRIYDVTQRHVVDAPFAVPDFD